MGQTLYNKYVFLPPAPTSYHIGDDLFETRVTSFPDPDGFSIPFALWRPPPSSTYEEFCLLYSHGNAEDIGLLAPLLSELTHQLGVATAIYEYSGYGPVPHPEQEETEGIRRREAPTEETLNAEVYAAYNHLRMECGFDPSKIVLFGRSLGSGPTCNLAHRLSAGRLPFAGVILQSPITSIVSVVSPILAHLSADMFNNLTTIQRILRPIVIIHGCADNVVPFAHAEQLVDLVRRATSEDESRLFRFVPLQNADHNDIEALYWNDILITLGDFLQHLQHADSFTFFSPRLPSPAASCQTPSCSTASCVPTYT